MKKQASQVAVGDIIKVSSGLVRVAKVATFRDGQISWKTSTISENLSADNLASGPKYLDGGMYRWPHEMVEVTGGF